MRCGQRHQPRRRLRTAGGQTLVAAARRSGRIMMNRIVIARRQRKGAGILRRELDGFGKFFAGLYFHSDDPSRRCAENLAAIKLHFLWSFGAAPKCEPGIKRQALAVWLDSGPRAFARAPGMTITPQPQ